MVAIVLVSHSRTLAAGVKELAGQMARASVPIAVAAGLDDPEPALGTDVVAVKTAIESVYSDDGVVLLVDLGSAVLAAEMAIDMLPASVAANVRLCDAPLVEGAVAAVATAAGGADLDRVLFEARAAHAAKVVQCGSRAAETSEAAETKTDAGDEVTAEMTVDNEHGIHARPAADIVTRVSRFQAEVSIRNLTTGGASASARSLNQLLMLGVRQGHRIAIRASGPDARAAVDAVVALAATSLGQSTVAVVQQPAAPLPPVAAAAASVLGGASLVGLGVSPGVAIAPVVHVRAALPEVEEQSTADPQCECEALDRAVAAAASEVGELADTLAASDAGDRIADILRAGQLWLEDVSLRQAARQRIVAEGRTAAAVWHELISDLVHRYQSLADPYQRARAADVQDAGGRVLRQLTGVAAHERVVAAGILIAAELRPSEVSQLDPETVRGVVLAAGNRTGHAAIIIRTLGIPTVVGAGSTILEVPDGAMLALDGATGQVWIDPDEPTRQALAARQAAETAEARRRAAWIARAAVTRDGHRISLLANITSVVGARQAVMVGAEGVGVLRTEILFLDRSTMPDEDEQYQTYRAIAEALDGRPLVIRTLDVGGDKPVPFLNQPPEANPFLGWRGVRQSLVSPQVFEPQLRALLRAGHAHDIKVLLPMVAAVRELTAAKQLLQQAREELLQAGVPVAATLEVGVMIEVPAAVAVADELAAEADFFSIGTNDLGQYVMAADRTNPAVAELADPMEPAVLRVVGLAVQAAHRQGIPACVCGEIAADPVAVPILLGLGVAELSMNAPAIPAIKEALATWTLDDARQMATVACRLASAREVRDYVAGKIGS